MIRKITIACLVMILIPLFVFAQTEGKTSARDKISSRAAQFKKQKEKARALKVMLIGKTISKEEQSVRGVDYTSSTTVGSYAVTKIGLCGEMSLSDGMVSRIYISLSEVKTDDGRIISEWAGKEIRVACESLKKLQTLSGKNIHINGVIRNGRKLKGKEIVITSVIEAL